MPGCFLSTRSATSRKAILSVSRREARSATSANRLTSDRSGSRAGNKAAARLISGRSVGTRVTASQTWPPAPRRSRGMRPDAYIARPLGSGPFPGMVVIHHAPGWDEWYRECTRRFAHHGYVAISPNLYFRDGHGTAEDVGAKVRAAGGVPDDQVLGDLDGANKLLRSLPYVSGKVGVFGTCSGGRHGFLAACKNKNYDALVECWGGGVVMKAEELTPKRPVAPIDYTKDLPCPMIGLFGNDDKSPAPEQVNLHEAELKKQGKNYEFHRYDGAGHGFFLLRPARLPPGTSRGRLEEAPRLLREKFEIAPAQKGATPCAR